MTACRFCSTPISWTRRDGRSVPLEADGAEHRCALAPRSIARRGRDDHVPGRRIVGALYQPSCGECETPPWEECACSARLAA